MQKTLSFSVAVCLVLTGCSQPSSPWSTVRAVRVDTRDSEDPSAAYAAHLSGVLKSANVQHKVVTYQYRYRTALREEAIGTRTAVIYRDDSNPANPWWLMDERLYKPVWLPGQDENRQVSFYLHRPATVVSSTTIGDGDSKGIIGVPEASTRETGMLARLDPVKKTERSGRWTGLFGRQQQQQQQRLANRDGAEQSRTRVTRSRSVPGSAQAPSRYATLFRARHGTEFDPASLIDRRKMEHLVLVSGARNARL